VRLGEFVIEGIDTTIPLFRTLVSHPEIVDGQYDIHWLESFLAETTLAD
jgi:acetyl-CoA carboxylase biotin carboxylase subunit